MKNRKTQNTDANSQPKTLEVEFDYKSTEAKEVFLAGDFNNWDFQNLPMKKDLTGTWHVRLPLHPGNYEYRFIVDGDWRNDPHACGFRPNEFGSSNCVLEVQLVPAAPKNGRVYEVVVK